MQSAVFEYISAVFGIMAQTPQHTYQVLTKRHGRMRSLLDGDMFRRTYWDTALAASDPVLRMLRDVAGIGQVLYGTDFPYLRRDLAVKSRQRLETDALNDEERAAVLGGTASSLFPRLKSVLATSKAASRRSPDTAR